MNFKRSVAIFGGIFLCSGIFAQTVEQADLNRWYISPGVGVMSFRKDHPGLSALLYDLRVGYDYSDHISYELGFLAVPYLDNDPQSNKHVFFNKAGIYGPHADILYHFSRWERFDPYISAGIGYLRSDDRIMPAKHHSAFSPRLGVGAMYHLSDDVSLRLNASAVGALTKDFDVFSAVDLGLVFRFGGSPASKPVNTKVEVPTGSIDTDGDGLTDEQEARLGTNPRDPDTDKDGLTDWEEVMVYKTDPLNPDSDFDMLSDGDEVHKYKTNPLDADTDKGGVSDGHEVLVDGTNPLDGSDDLMMFELKINFDYDQTVVKPEYIPDLATIVRVMQRNPNAKAKIEGHADRRTRSSTKYNQDLSQQRANRVMELIVARGITPDRLTATGYGFTRPKVQPDLVNGNPENRRVEVYISNAGGLLGKQAIIKQMESGN